jgi:YMGG-like Gly-zipper
MTPIRSRWLWCALVLWAGLPLMAQQTVNAPHPNSNAIPEGTTFLIRLQDKLDTSKSEQGKKFTAKLAEDLVAPDGAVIPRGKKVKGHVSAVEQGIHARMLLSFNEIETNHGWMPLLATVTGVPGEHAAKQPDEEGNIERKGTSARREVEAAAVGAGLGAGTGAIAGGGHGAAIGAGAGAAVGALAGFLTGHDLKLDKGTVLELRLDHPLQVPTH